MKARFIGRDGSLGYRHRQVYDLTVKEWKPLRPAIVSPFYCPYSSWEKFYENWTPVDWENS